MQRIDGRLLFSATDLMRFTGCLHATSLDLDHLDGVGPVPGEVSDDARLLQARGDAHEAAHLASLKAAGLGVVEVDRDGLSLVEGVERTRQALTAGPDIVFQGALAGGAWGGWSDFLEKVDRPSALGDYSYEVADTKLKRKPHPKHLLQLVLYSDLLAEMQGLMPEKAHVELGDGSRASFRLADYAAYARRARQRLESFAAERPATRPMRCADCALCRWAHHCESVWEVEDSLLNVANITRRQIARLEAAGITTLAALSRVEGRVPGMAQETFGRLVSQARLQEARKTGEPAHALRPRQPGKGFDLLPEPQPGDVFYDIEGDPHVEGGLEYLHGLWADGAFTPFWAHDHEAEAAALRDLLAWFRRRIEESPGARIYHYAPYEVTALKRLTAKYGIGEAFLDRLLRERRFVDLFAVVRGGILASERNYSIKSMEVFYGIERAGEVKTAGGSVVAYEAWRETGDEGILQEILDYNRIDCISTEKLRDWLVGVRLPGPWPEPAASRGDQEAVEDAEAEALRGRLRKAGLTPDRQALLFDLAQYHRREDKPVWWSIFDSLAQDTDELIDNTECLGGLEPVDDIRPVLRSFERTFRFPEQETKLRAGGNQNATVPVADGIVGATITALDPKDRLVTVKVGRGKSTVLENLTSLHPGPPLNTDGIRAAIGHAIADQCEAQHYRALDDLLSRRAPRFRSGHRADILEGREPVEGTIEAVFDMDETVLPIQGPPGSGKTYVSARAILALVRDGKRVGVSSTSHEAIRNVLMGVLEACGENDPAFGIAHRLSEDTYPENCRVERATRNDDDALAEARIVGGTVFFFSRAENQQAFDYLFVDEAGQVGLASTLALATAARNLVLVGDPRQLPQVVQGAHPHPANLSCHEWMLGEDRTFPRDRGIFLPITRRMHPDVCRFISRQVYEGRLENHLDTARQGVAGIAGLPAAGAHFVPVEHQGNAQMAPEEIGAIHATIEKLLAGRWTDRDGASRDLDATDIIVVAPYNVQVNALRAALPEAVRVGTVDKFQGQEAPVCLVSMTSSSADDMPRGLDFLLSLNRINVAISRAKGLALVFASPRLLEASCAKVEDMALVNALCALAEMSVVEAIGRK
ncbi:TM0106 family RecB-like putative nuclease [Oceanibacterium hippocampi]|uniref:RecBCD enzyme subunit RecD n=1 Tax=Oceanibacterium hippocampi TaxID=745714 RepID=A0A1Y5TZZ9_9PROT|nr:TM0106 family RecB-like putative nuclease [Oceanibacterium hippocampi]SLN77770.1 RecBCD enzyme subunit RecD [Oceanibacterium hippocampi]